MSFYTSEAVTIGEDDLLYVVKETSESLRLVRQKEPSHGRLTTSKIIVDKSCTRSAIRTFLHVSGEKRSFY